MVSTASWWIAKGNITQLGWICDELELLGLGLEQGRDLCAGFDDLVREPSRAGLVESPADEAPVGEDEDLALLTALAPPSGDPPGLVEWAGGRREAGTQTRHEVALGGGEGDDGLDVSPGWCWVRADGERLGGCSTERCRCFAFGFGRVGREGAVEKGAVWTFEGSESELEKSVNSVG